MKKILYLSFALFAVAACSESEQTVETKTDVLSEQEVVVEANKMLTMDIDGMVCKMGCGGAIRKELKATGAISHVDFDFDEERTTNTATVYFDNSKIDASKIVKLVSEINDNQFTVGETSEDDYAEVNTDESNSNSSSESTDIQVDASTSSVEIPNLLDVLADFFI